MKTSLVAGLLGGAAALVAVAFLARSWRAVALVVPLLLYLAVGALLAPPKVRVHTVPPAASRPATMTSLFERPVK